MHRSIFARQAAPQRSLACREWHNFCHDMSSRDVWRTGYGGPVTELGYTYTHNGAYYSGEYTKAFMLKSSAEDYVSKIHIGSQVAVRVKPTDPETSVVAVDD